MKGSQLYRARKAMELKWTRDMTHEEIADELDVTRQTVSGYLNDPPEELKEPAQHFKQELIHGTVELLREQLATARERAENAEKPSKVFATDDNGDLRTKEIHLEGGATKTVPVVEDMEMAPNHEVRSYARKEARQIIQMLWNLSGAEEPDEQRVEHTDGEGGNPFEFNVTFSDDA